MIELKKSGELGDLVEIRLTPPHVDESVSFLMDVETAVTLAQNLLGLVMSGEGVSTILVNSKED